MASYIVVPGAVTSSTATAFPDDAPDFAGLTSVIALTLASGGTASITSPENLTVVTALPSGGLGAKDILLGANSSGSQTWEYGASTTSGTVLIFNGYGPGERIQVS